jgi:phosphoribosylformylglycinamidine synthase
MTIGFKAEEQDILLIGGWGDELGQSLWLREIHGREDGPPPAVNLEEERRNGEFIRACIENGDVSAVHDVSDGGPLVTITEMALAGDIGVELFGAWPLSTWFAESQGRYIVAARHGLDVQEAAKAAGVFCRTIGSTRGKAIRSLAGGGEILGSDGKLVRFSTSAVEISLADLRRAHEGFFPGLMGGEIAIS